jgi:hypothetical protein
MLAMNSLRLVLASFALVVCAVPATTGAQPAAAAPAAPAAAAAPACNVLAAVPDTARTFSTLSGSSPWVEYQSLAYAPDPTGLGGMYAQYWTDSNGAPSVFMIEPGTQGWIYVTYCFNAAGQLENVSFILTAPTWSYRLDGTVTQGALQAQTSYFFDASSGNKIPKPDGADALADAMKPVLYLDTSKLPFAALLAQPAKLPAK